MTNKYYAELGTNKKIREQYFPDFDYKGVIVEVGGATPDFLSMSKHFKDNGWRSIIVEPNPTFAQMHRDAGNEIYEYACDAQNEDNRDFTIFHQSAAFEGGIVTDQSFSALKIKEEYLKQTHVTVNDSNSTNIKVNVRRLDYILDLANVKKIDILSIDTEGWELEVMKGFDTSKIECNIIILENFTYNPSYNEYMNTIGYALIDRVDYNYIYTKKTII